MNTKPTTTTEETFSTTVSFDVTDYGEAVLVEVRPSESARHTSIRKKSLVFSGPTFRRMQRRHGRTSWVLDTKETRYRVFRVVTPEYFEHYASGEMRRFKFKGERLSENPADVLAGGDFRLAVWDNTSYDGNLYGLDGRAVPRAIWVDYVHGHLKGTENEMASIVEKLSAHEQVTGVRMIEIFPCNADFEGQRGVEYMFTPTPRQFALWGPGQHSDESYSGAYDRIRKLVKCGR